MFVFKIKYNSAIYLKDKQAKNKRFDSTLLVMKMKNSFDVGRNYKI